MRAVHASAAIDPSIVVPPSRSARVWTRDDAIVELLRGRVGILGPTTARALADSLAIDLADADAALLALESEGVVLRGSFSPAALKGCATTSVLQDGSQIAAHRPEAVQGRPDGVAHSGPEVVERRPELVAHGGPEVVERRPDGVAHSGPEVVERRPEHVAHGGPEVVERRPDGVAHGGPAVVERRPELVAHGGPEVVERRPDGVAHSGPEVVERRPELVAHGGPEVVERRPDGVAHSGPEVVERRPELVAHGGPEVVERRPDGVAQGFSPAIEWCDRRLLARIHRYTLNRLRAEIEPVSPADFMRFLFAWQHVEPSSRLTGLDGLRATLEALDGFELAADAWERFVLPDRVEGYQPSMLDTLCLTGEVGWARLSSSARDATQLVGATPIAMFLREHGDAWRTLREPGREPEDPEHQADRDSLDEAARLVLDALRARGALFVPELAKACGLDDEAARGALADLVAAGLVASDGFGGLRLIVGASGGRRPPTASRHNVTGRWSLLAARQPGDREAAVELQARTLLRRYGVVFRKLLAREANVAPWRELTRVYRRLEARGEIRGGRFVSGMSGEQFALGDAIERLREIRRTPGRGRCLVISAADPLNLAGIITTGDRVRAVAAGRLAYVDGVPIAALEGDYVRPLIVETDIAPALAATVATSLTGRPMPAVLSGFVGRS